MRRAEIIERKKRALTFAKKIKELPSGEIIKKLMQEFQYSYSSARNILMELGIDNKSNKKELWKDYNKNNGKGLKAYLDKLEAKEQEVIERKRLEKEHREKFQF